VLSRTRVTNHWNADGKSSGTKWWRWRKQAVGISARKRRRRKKEEKEELKPGGDHAVGWFPMHGRRKRW
jgi:hypothetical protein